MNEKLIEKIKSLRSEIIDLNTEISKKEVEINKIWVENEADFEGSYVEFFNGDDYIYMRVEKQTIWKFGYALHLEGPAITLDDSPLEDFEDISFASYNESDVLFVDADVLKGIKDERIRKINKKDMKFVVDAYCRTIKDNFI